MSYTWADLMLGIDSRRESRKERKQYERIRSEKAHQQNIANQWKTGLSLLGTVLGLGPVSTIIGKGAELVVDWAYGNIFEGWEGMEVEEGKFDRDLSRQVNKQLDKEADAETISHVTDTLLTLGKAYVQAGGVTASKAGEKMDWTTYGHGDDAWTLWGKGTPGGVKSIGYGDIDEEGWAALVDTPYSIDVPASEDYVPSFLDMMETKYKGKGTIGEHASELQTLIKQ